MSGPSAKNDQPITDKRDLVAYLEGGSKPREHWMFGTEHEKFPFRKSDLSPLSYDGPDGIGALLEGLTRFGWQRVEEAGKLIALTHQNCSITLEPGGQLELSGAPLRSVHQTCEELQEHLRQVREIGDELGIGMLGLGFAPTWRREDIHWMPKGRYAIMRRYMPTRGALGLDMMLRTCTVQVNLDFADEADMVKKYRVSLALQPLATALWANSPFTEGKPNGFFSYRSQIWTDTDPDRTGDLPFVFEDGMGFERYVDYLLDMPMYFVYRDGQYIDCAGQSFRDFIDGKLPQLPGELPTMGDFTDHMTTAFPEVRLKRYLEMRGTDGGPWGRICALPAFWVGLLYDDQALDEAWHLVRDWKAEERAAMRRDVPKTGLATRHRGEELQELAKRVLAIARQGLARRARRDGWNQDETHFLNHLDEIAESGISPAREMLKRYYEEWDERVEPVFARYAY